MKFIPNAVSRKVAKQVLITQKHSPTLLFAAGVVGITGTVVLACRATLRLDEVLEETNATLENVKKVQHANYSEQDRKQDLAIVYARSAVGIAKLYGPAFILGVTSIACLTGSHKILTRRNAALTGAYAALEKGFNEYRKRVSDEFGEEKEKELRYAAETQTVVIDDVNGPKKVKEKIPGRAGASIYAQLYEEGNPNWQPTPEYNRIFLEAQQQYANQRLRAKGFLMLNDVYDSLGIQRTSAGQIVGWVWNHGDNYVDFGLNDWPSAVDYVNGREHAILLDFNVDGKVFDLIDKI